MECTYWAESQYTQEILLSVEAKRYSRRHFESACIDKKVAKSLCGLLQLRAYCEKIRKHFTLKQPNALFRLVDRTQKRGKTENMHSSVTKLVP